ncbi:MAG: deacylase [Acidobacteria bacterium RIFCSPLOWO2_12_FULL_54_10]|nr:MAG: deacylase [Acidobacteria bacterium RIFCSPLOWO2_12_FULL_54_10]
MYLLTRIKQYLDQSGVPYEHHVHRTAFTAQEIAAEEHVPGKLVAKTVVLKVDGKSVMAVLPASEKVDLAAFQAQLNSKDIRLATEFEFAGIFPDCEVGAMPPFGNLYNLPVYVDDTLTKDPEIVFNAGTHQDTIRIKYSDFARLVQPQIFSFSLVLAA